MKTIKAMLLDVDYLREERSIIRLFFKTSDGKIVLTDPSFEPYFYITVNCDPEEAVHKLMQREFNGVKIKRIEIVERTMLGEEKPVKALKLIFNSTKDVKDSRESIREQKFVTHKREYDIPFSKRYLIDRDLEPLAMYEVTYDEQSLELKEMKKIDEKPFELKIAAIDIETYSRGRFSDPKRDPIIMASYVDDEERVVICTKPIKVDYAIKVADEKKLIEVLIEKIKSKDLDIIVTYNGDSFDLPYLKERARQLGIKFDVGVDGSEPRSVKKGLDIATKIKGRLHVDAYQVLRMLARFGVVNLVKMDLESVNSALFNEFKEKISAEEINDIWESGKGLERLAEYNRKDSEVAYRIIQDYLPLFIELGKLVHYTLFDATRGSSSQLVEALLMIEAFKKGALVPNKPSEEDVKIRLMQTYQGGFVYEPLPGLHENIAVLDFTSLHPTIIISHNISPDTVNCKHAECKTKNASPAKHWFCTKKRGFLPEVIERLFNERVRLKRMLKSLAKDSHEYKLIYARQHSLKIILNSFYGTLGYARFRWYSRECASAVTAWSREYVQMVGKEAEKAGFVTVYGDSITEDRFVTVMDDKGQIKVMNIKELFEESAPIGTRNGKEIRKPSGLKALSVNPKTLEPEWQKIKEVVRHKTSKAIYRVNQKYGETRVTEDHSLLVLDNGQLAEVKPTELKHMLFKVESIPRGKNIKKLDLYEELKHFTYKTLYKGKVKIMRIHTDGEYIWFGWTNQKKPVKLKRTIEVGSKEFNALCRLLGAYIAEGSSSTKETTESRFGASIASSDEEWLRKLRKDYLLLFKNAKASIIVSNKKKRHLNYCTNKKMRSIAYTDKTKKLQMMNGLSAVLFKGLCGQKSAGKHLPSFIFNVGKKYKKVLLEEYIKGDGYRSTDRRYSSEYKKKYFKITTKSLALASGLSLLLTQLGIKHTITYRKDKGAYSIQTSSRYNLRVETKVKKEQYSGYVYDLAVEKNNNFVDACGQILLHNTDSAFIKIPAGKNREDVLKFLEYINSKLPGVMNLELEGFYKRGIFVTKKTGEQAAKKRYALIDDNGNLKIVGFEYVRRDWAPIAKETQRRVIEAILKEGKPEKAIEIVRQKIKELRSGKTKKEELIIYSQIKKAVDAYESIGPHVAAAKKAMARGKQIEEGSVIGYIVTKCGKSISDKAQLEEYVSEGNYDAEYYIKHQLIPAVIKIIREFGYSEEDLIEGGRQVSLGAFS
jgi:DNA polymerase I